MVQLRRLGKTDIEVTPLGLGCWQFSGGKGLGGSYWDPVAQEQVSSIVKAALAGGINWFDTAEAYGWGFSEQCLAAALGANGKKNGDVRVATKWWPIPRTASSIPKTIDERVRRLAPFEIDLYQVHQPYSLASVKGQMDALADLVAAHKVRSVGVSNFGVSRMRRAHDVMEKRGLPLASNQVRYSLLDRKIERNGILKAAKELGITVIAYSPLAQGILSGKFHEDPSLISKRGGPRKLLPAFRSSGLKKSQPVIDELRAIAKAHGGTPSQVALAWVLQIHGDTIVAIPGASKDRHVTDAVASMDLKLSAHELQKLEELSRPFC